MSGWYTAKMSGKVKVSGTWRDSTAPYVKVGGNWKIAKSAWAKVDDKWKSWFLQGGLVEPLESQTYPAPEPGKLNFNNGADGEVKAIAIQPDGKIILGGYFLTFGGTAKGRIVRLNSDGTIDESFLATGIGQFYINTIAIQNDGKILVGGNFPLFNGITTFDLMRLNSDGTTDTDFVANIGGGSSNSVNAIGVQSDGKIIVGGSFTTFNGATANRILRLNSNGTLDTAFTSNIGTGFNNIINTLAIQSDDKIVIAGSFATLNGATVNRIARLNSNGSPDTAFNSNIGTGFNSTVISLAIQPDGKIVVTGVFATLNGATVNRIARLNSNGSPDTAFTSNTGTGLSSIAYGMAIQPDGKIVIGGAFITLNGVTATRIARLNSDGTLDTAFNANTGTGFDNSVSGIAIQSDGKIIAGGIFLTFDGITVNRIISLNSDGTSNTYTQSPKPFNNSLQTIKTQSDGKILIGGFFTAFDEITTNRIARLNSDGTLDSAFTTNMGTGFSDNVKKIAIQSDGKIIAGGNFWTFNGITVNHLARLNSDGTLDTAFTSNTGTGFNSTIESITIQPDGKILVGGRFATLNGAAAPYIVRLNSNGSPDTAFNSNLGTGFNNYVFTIKIQPDGKIVVCGNFSTLNGTTVNYIARLNSDGTLDTAFNANIGTGFGNYVNSIAIQTDGKILVGGVFSTFNGISARYIARLNSDGTLDTAFSANIGSKFNLFVNYVVIQYDGKIVAGGRFTNFDGTAANYLARLNSDGTTDTNFISNLGTGADGNVNALEIQVDNKILIAGVFKYINSVPLGYIARIGGEIAA